jgi:hypothetical protein
VRAFELARTAGVACCWLPVLLAVSASRASAQPTAPHGPVPEVRAARIARQLETDGRPSEDVRVQAQSATAFTQKDPDEGKPSTEATDLQVLYDDDAVYVRLRLHDTAPTGVVRRLTRRDQDPDGDRVTVYLDPRHDHLTGFSFWVTAAGAQGDAVIYNDTWSDTSWDAVWEATVSSIPDGWTAELRIPFSQLRFDSSPQQVWGINAARYIQRKNETDWLELVPKKESGLASRMAHLTGLDGIPRKRHLELLPYTVSRAEFIPPDDSDDPFNDGSRLFGGAGLDMKWGVTSNLTLNTTINPDFGQVEVDPAVVNLTAFETYFEERRPFFIEGSQVFSSFGRGGSNSFWGFNSSEPELFYSRRIGRTPQGDADGDFVDQALATTILGAAKLTGKTSRGWTLGLLDAVTSREWARVATGDVRTRAEIEPATNYFVGRLRREVQRAGVGLIATAVNRNLRDSVLRDELVRQAYVAGGDGYFFFDRKREWVVSGQMSASRVSGSAAAVKSLQEDPRHYFQRPDAPEVHLDPTRTSMSGWSGRATLNRNSGNWTVNATLWGVSPGFESNDLGFHWRGDTAGAHGVFLWQKHSPDKWTRYRNAWVSKWWTWNFARETTGDGFMFAGNATLLNYWNVWGNLWGNARTVDSTLTRGGPAAVVPARRMLNAGFSSDSRRRVSFSFSGNYSWDGMGRWDASGGPSLSLKPTSSITLSVGPSLRRNSEVAHYVDTISDPLAATFGNRYVFAALDQTEVSMTTRASLVLSPKMSLQVYAQPLLSAGRYWGFKEFAAPRTFDFSRYDQNGSLTSYNAGDDEYSIDPDGDGPAAPFTFDNPSFNIKSLRLNAVFRWEWRPGSTLFVVWTQQREDEDYPGQFNFNRDLPRMLRAKSDDVFLVKLSYWFAR